jgi:hypothetical protein
MPRWKGMGWNEIKILAEGRKVSLNHRQKATDYVIA